MLFLFSDSRCYQEVLERQAGDHMINPRVHHNVAETLEAMRGYSDALKHERLSYAGCVYEAIVYFNFCNIAI